MDLRHVYLTLLFVVFITGCSSKPVNPYQGDPIKAFDNSSVETVEDLFYSFLIKDYLYWKGTPYRLGGNSKKGIDCSALVQDIFKNSFKITIPRTTNRQVKLGKFVDRSDLQVSDLVFFKTGWNVRHVGIYMGNNEFLHASVSQGVIISSLNNVYWKGKYWQSRRVMD